MRIGTRGSALALAQASWVADRLGAGAELVTVTTAGDRAERLSDKSRWVSELEQALLDGRIDAAVHSAKDVPGRLAPGTGIVAVPVREDPHDALCGARSLHELALGARVGTSSLRRAAQLRARRPDLQVIPIRGNVDTRLRKLAAGEVDALVLALAGLRRLGRDDAADAILEEMIPAPGQGALAVQAVQGSDAEWQLVDALDDPEANACLGAERDLVDRLDASCNSAVAAQARVVEVGEAMEMRAWVGLPDGSEWISDTLVDKPYLVSERLAERLLRVGARRLIQAAEHEVSES
jgi:hydroxymethylbilane synthase